MEKDMQQQKEAGQNMKLSEETAVQLYRGESTDDRPISIG